MDTSPETRVSSLKPLKDKKAELKKQQADGSLSKWEVKVSFANEVKVHFSSEKEIVAELQKEGFNNMQARQIARGQLAGIDVSIYKNKQFNFRQMTEIRLGLNDKLDVSIYARPDVDSSRMDKIRACLKNNHYYKCFFDCEVEDIDLFYHIVRNKNLSLEDKLAKIALRKLEK